MLTKLICRIPFLSYNVSVTDYVVVNLDSPDPDILVDHEGISIFQGLIFIVNGLLIVSDAWKYHSTTFKFSFVLAINIFISQFMLNTRPKTVK